MTYNLDDLKSSFSRKLDAQRQQRQASLQAELQRIREQYAHLLPASLPADVARRLQAWELGRPASVSPAMPVGQILVPAMVDLGRSAPLRDLDAAFTAHFRLTEYYPANLLGYPTIYCHTLEEFYQPLAEVLYLSEQARLAWIDQAVAEAKQRAVQTEGGGTFGYNLPGQGCYLNGWLFAQQGQSTAEQALQSPELLPHILSTAAHEKLGHGFLALYSTLGRVKVRLGLEQMDMARRFGLRTADDPLSSLHMQQNNLLFMVSQLLEEGWATWIEHYLAAALLGAHERHTHSSQAVLEAIQHLPRNLEQRTEIQQLLVGAMAVLFGEETQPPQVLHAAVRLIEDLGGQLDDHFGQALRQPLRYAVGELLMLQVEANQGSACAPYTVLIAANLSFDLAQISLSDLAGLLSSDPRLSPDARLAVLSRLVLEQPGSIAELAQRAESELSFSTPPEIKRSY